MPSVTSESNAVEVQRHWHEAFVRALKGRSLAECIESGGDNILQLRLIAALLVILGHSYALVGLGAADDPVHRLLPCTATHLVGVMMFFTISGFLITLSFQRRPDLRRFLQARALRLWPALIVCVAAWAFLLGPALSTLPAHTYFSSGGQSENPYSYFWGNASLFDMQWFLPGVFTNNPIRAFVNASLWTIPYEATMYLCVAVFGIVGMFRHPKWASIAIAAAVIKLILWPMYSSATPPRAEVWFGVKWFGVVLGGLFGAGSIACLLRRHVRISSGLLVLVVGTCLLLRTSTIATPALWLAVVYFVLWLAYVPKLPPIPRKWDLSYGTYLWAFPVQQAVVTLTGVTQPLALFAMATPLVLAIALASWVWIEKPALKFKDLGWRAPSIALQVER